MFTTKNNPKIISVRYLRNNETAPVYMASVGGGEIGNHQGNYTDVDVQLNDARASSICFDIDTTGFVLCNQRTKVTNFYDDKQISPTYESELCEKLSSLTGAKHVEIFDHTRRSSNNNIRVRRSIREPASIVHNDYTANSGLTRLKAIYAQRGNDVDALLQKRFAIVNIWRSISGEVRNHPMALCDAQSVLETDLVPVTRQAADRTGELQLAHYNELHQWYYYPKMTADEILVFKTYDSATDGTTRYTLHTSFDEGNSLDRESIETRCFVFY